MASDSSVRMMDNSLQSNPEKRCEVATLSVKWLLTIYGVAFVVRAGWGLVRFGVAAQGGLEFPDEQDYWSIATSIATTGDIVGEHGYRALRMPLYPAFLSLFSASDHGVLLARIFQWMMGAFAPVFAGVLGARVGGICFGDSGGRWCGILAGLLVACDPFLIFFSSLLLTETPAIMAICLLWLVAMRGLTHPPTLLHWSAIGLAASFCVYLRESSIFLAIPLLCILVLRDRCRGRSLAGAAVAMLVIVVTLLPWAVRNKHVTGEMCWLTHRGGISLYDGVGPQADGSSNLGDIKQMPEVRALDEVGWNRYFLDASLDSIREDPVRILGLAVVKILRTWNPLPNVQPYQSGAVRFVSVAWTVPVYLFGMVGCVVLFRRDRVLCIAMLIPVFAILLMHAVFVGSVRYRLPAMPLLEILAAVGVVHTLGRGWLVQHRRQE